MENGEEEAIPRIGLRLGGVFFQSQKNNQEEEQIRQKIETHGGGAESPSKKSKQKENLPHLWMVRKKEE